MSPPLIFSAAAMLAAREAADARQAGRPAKRGPNPRPTAVEFPSPWSVAPDFRRSA